MFADADEYMDSMQWVPQAVERLEEGGMACHAHEACTSLLLMEWHLFPKALQMALWGQFVAEEAIWVCPNMWYGARRMLGWALTVMDAWDQTAWNKRYGWASYWTLWMVQTAFDKFRAAQAIREQGARTTPVSIDPEVALCSRCGGGFVPHLSTFVHHCQNPKPWLDGSDSAVSGPYAMRKAAREEAEGLARSASPTDSGSGCA